MSGVAPPLVFDLSANYPNPFNPLTTIRFTLPSPQPVRLAVFSVDGRRVRTLADAPYAAGAHKLVWDGASDAGRPVASGTYFLRIDAGPHQQVRKMALIR
ncbi:MAG: T9SS type A sorting domain-containing protein [Thioalkalivibrio sp.]|nr:T9SS type A sorting domain-containing protein [Thioalkalivibrio sp.]